MNSKENAQPKEVDFNEIAQLLIGPKRVTDRVIIPMSIGNQLKTKEELRVQAIFESCAFKTITSCAAGMLKP